METREGVKHSFGRSMKQIIILIRLGWAPYEFELVNAIHTLFSMCEYDFVINGNLCAKPEIIRKV